MQGFVHVWQRSSAPSMCYTCAGMQERPASDGVREGGNVFGSGSRTPVAVTLLVKNPNATYEGCKIHYRDIGDYLTREEKLEALTEAKSIKGFSDWQTITPNKHHDWIDQRSDAFAEFYPLGTKEAKAGRADDANIQIFSNGYGDK